MDYLEMSSWAADLFLSRFDTWLNRLSVYANQTVAGLDIQ